MKKFFTELTRIQKFVPKKHNIDLIKKQLKLNENKVYEGMNISNTNELAENPKRDIYYPTQHPKNLNNEDTNIITYKPPVKYITPFHRIPPDVLSFVEPKFDSPMDAKHLDIGILGPPNSGKSSLINCLIGSNISAVSNKYGTTYETIEGIYTDINDKVQLVFKDTPGAVKVSSSIRSKRISTKAWTIIPECDQLMFVVDSVKHLDSITSEAIKRLLSHKYKPSLLKIMRNLKINNYEDINIDDIDKIRDETLDEKDYEPKNISTLLIMNKIDLVVNKRKLKKLQEELEDIGAFDKVFYISCITNYGIESLKEHLKSKAIRRKWRYHPDLKSTQSEVEKCEEILKQIIFNRFYQEFPYLTTSMVTSWVPSTNGELRISFKVEVKSDHNTQIFVGKDGRTISELRKELDKQLTIFIQKPVRTIINVVNRNNKKLEYLGEYNDSSV